MIRTEINKALKKTEKRRQKELKALKHRCQEIGMLKDRVKQNCERVTFEKKVRANAMKNELIKKEIQVINKKDGEVRKLGQFESQILIKLKETHIRQKQAISEISELFQQPMFTNS